MAEIKIFISSVQSEFAQERKQLCEYIRTDVLLGKFFRPFIFEELPAINLSAPEAYIQEVKQSDIYLGIYGERYGYEDTDGISPTEREFDAACEAHRHRLVFMSVKMSLNPTLIISNIQKMSLKMTLKMSLKMSVKMSVNPNRLLVISRYLIHF